MAAPDLFHDLNDIDRATARRRFRAHRMGAGDVLTRAGDVGRGLAIVEEGELIVEVDGTTVGTVGVGGMLGEMGLFADGRRMATVRAAAPTVLSLLTREGYEELRDTVHPICHNIEAITLASQVERLRATGARVASLRLGVPAAVRPSTGFFAAVARLFGSGAVTPTTGDPFATLRSSRLFSGAPAPALEPIAAAFGTLSARSGAFLCTEGERGDRMYVLESGRIEVIVSTDGAPVTVATLEPGAAFGMVSLAEGGPRMASCVVRDDAVVHVLGQDGWDALVHEPHMVGSTFRRAVIRAFSDQLDYSNAQLAAYENRTSAETAAARLRNAHHGLESHDRVVAPEG
jgi:CRP-like cAMP-binding protein